MCRTLVGGLAPALLVALALAPPALASPLLTLRHDGTTLAREDRFLPPAGETRLAAPSARAAAAHRTPPADGMRLRAAASRRTVRGELARMLASRAIDRATHDEKRAIYANARALHRRLSGARRAALGAVLHNLDDVARAGGLTVSRLPALFETVARNRRWWANGPLLSNGARVSFEGSRLVWQFYAGEGLQIQWLGTFGKANGLWQGRRYDGALRALLDEAVALAAQRADGIAWEYLFDFDGGRPPWVSGLAQGTAVQALARAAVRLGEPRFFDAARAGLGIFRAAPPSGVRVATPAGAHYLIYSFAPRLHVLNGFTQALNGLHDFAALANDAGGRALFAAGEAQLRSELAAYDTGAWSRYSRRREADLHYHKLARDFLRNLCTRLTEDASPAPAAGSPAGGTALPVGGLGNVMRAPPVADPAPYCAAAQRWTRYLAQAPVVELRSRRVRGGRPATVKFTLSKPSYVTLRLLREGRTVVVLGGRFGGGVRTLRWPQPPRGPARLRVVLRATDLAGNDGGGEATLRVLRASR